ncbi:MAG: response regulator transcription factor [Phycisphaerae bacterium]
MATTVLLADDHKIVRDGLKALLEREDDMDVVGEADNGREAVRLARDLAPDIVIMDISMPDLNGMEATRQVCRRCPGTRVMALSVHADRRFVTEMLKAGASGYLLKDSAFEDLVRGIRTVLRGHTYLSPPVADAVVESHVRAPAADAEATGSVLTPREREVLQLLTEGHGTKQIARHLHVSTKTVDTHRQHIMDKLDIHNVAELTKYAIREGLTDVQQ